MKIHYWMHLITRISLKKSIEVHFNRSKIFLLYHYYANDVNMRKKNSAEIWLIHAEKMSYRKFHHFIKKSRHSLRLNNSSKTFLNQSKSTGYRRLRIILVTLYIINIFSKFGSFLKTKIIKGIIFVIVNIITMFPKIK